MTTSSARRWIHPATTFVVSVVLLSGVTTVVSRTAGGGDGAPPVEVLGERFDAAGQGVVAGSAANGNGQDKAKKAFSMSGTVLGQLYPGAQRTLRVTVSNPNSQDIQLLGLAAAAQDPAPAGCDRDWVVVTGYRYAGGSPVVVAGKGGTRTVDLAITLVNLPDVNQDACKAATFPLVLSGSARSTT